MGQKPLTCVKIPKNSGKYPKGNNNNILAGDNIGNNNDYGLDDQGGGNQDGKGRCDSGFSDEGPNNHHGKCHDG